MTIAAQAEALDAQESYAPHPIPEQAAQETLGQRLTFVAALLAAILATGAVIGTALSAALAWAAQAHFERTHPDLIRQAREEQAMLVSKGYSSPKPVGNSLAAKWSAGRIAESFGQAHTDAYDYGSAGSNAFLSSEPAAGAVALPPFFAKIGVPVRRYLNFTSSMEKQSEPMRAFVLRHEDAHAELWDRGTRFSSQLLDPEQNKAAAALIESGTELGKRAGQPPHAGLSLWMAGFYHEAWADARSILLSEASRPGSLASTALLVHRYRIAGLSENQASSFIAAGESHATDIAVFLAAQIPAAIAATLGREELDSLSDRIASDALALTLSRLGAKERISGSAAESDLKAAFAAMEPERAQELSLAWQRLSKTLFADQPFGPSALSYGSGQRAFRALLPRPEGLRRFDGIGGFFELDDANGLRILEVDGASFFDQLPFDPEAVSPKKAKSLMPERAAALERRDRRAASAFKAASGQHRQLARILGLPLDELAQGKIPEQSSLPFAFRYRLECAVSDDAARSAKSRRSKSGHARGTIRP